MGESLNKVSFRRKMVEMAMFDLLEGEMETRRAHRPTQLYRLKSEFKAQPRLLERGL
jgi:8-oxo-dGTP diphosphatase